MTDRPLTELIHGCFDQTLSEAEFRVLNDRLREDPAAAREFARVALLHDQLHNLHNVSLTAVPAAHKAEPQAVRRRWLTGIVCAAIVGCAVWAFVWLRASPLPSRGTLAEINGDVRVEDAEGKPRPLAESIRPGDRIVTSGLNSVASLRLQDGSQVTLQGNAAVRWSNDEHTIFADAGLVSAISPASRGSPFFLATPTARVNVSGTTANVWATASGTEVDVSAGRAHVGLADGGQTLEVPAGRRAIAAADGSVRVVTPPPLETSWSVDFEQGLPDGWLAEFVRTGLPNGSHGAARAIYDPNYGGHFVIGVRGDPQGLFQITPTSHLHLTFKVGPQPAPRWLNLFLATRSRDPHGPFFLNHKSMALSRNYPPLGEWQTLSIPLTDFHRRAPGVEEIRDWTGPAPNPEEIPMTLWIGAPPPDRGLVIDRIWITEE